MLKRCLILVLALLLLSSAAFAEGVLRPLPIDLSGGAPYDEEYESDLLVYEDPSIRVERTLRTQNKELRLEYYTVDIRIHPVGIYKALILRHMRQEPQLYL